MLFTCRPRACAAARTADRKIIKRGNKSFAVDFHCHVQTPAADELAKQTTVAHRDPIDQHGSHRTAERQRELRQELDKKLTSVEQRLKDMEPE